MSRQVALFGLEGMPEVRPGDDLAGLISEALKLNQLRLQRGDVLVVAQKVVSKSEHRLVCLSEVVVGAEAADLAAQTQKDPRIVQLILDESKTVIRKRAGLIIVEHRLGIILANAGIDQSNLSPTPDEWVLLLPENPDRSASHIRAQLSTESDGRFAVIINDSVGRAWRNGTIGMVLGSAGIEPVRNQVGQPDLHGRKLAATEIALADELASAASLVMGQAAESRPVVLIRGASWDQAETGSSSLLRSSELDLFR